MTPVNQNVLELQRNIGHVIPALTEIPDTELLALVQAVERAYAHILIEAGLRGVVEY